MAKPSASSSGKTSIAVTQWNKSSFMALVDLKSAFHDAFFVPMPNLNPIERFVEALSAGIDRNDHRARGLVKRWTDLAFASTDMLGPSKLKLSEKERYETFFKTHKALLGHNRSNAATELNKARKRAGLVDLKQSEQNFKRCLIFPDLPNPQTEPEAIRGGADTGQVHTSQEPPSTTPGASDGTLSNSKPNKVPATQRPEQPAGSSSNEPVQNIHKRMKKKKLRGLAGKKPELDPQMEPEAYLPTPPLLDDAPLPLLPAESRATSPIPDIAAAPSQEQVIESAHRRSGKKKKGKKSRNKSGHSTSTTQTPEIADKDLEDVLNLAVDSQVPEHAQKRVKKKSRRGDLRVGERSSLRVALEQSKGAENARSRLTVNTDTAPDHLTPPWSAEPLEGMVVDPPLGSQGDAGLEPTTNSQTPPPNAPMDLPVALRLYYPNSEYVLEPETKPLFEPEVELEAALEAKLAVEPRIETGTELSCAPRAEIEVETQATLQVKTGIETTLGPADLRSHNKIIPVWTVSRQELCELPYFKSMQGGVYTRANTVYGYLLGRFPSPRDAWCHDGRLIISHGGGKNIADEGEANPDEQVGSSSKPKHQLGGDQLESDKSIRALLTSYRMLRPIAIMAEADYEPLLKFDLKQGHAKEANYYVLGHYAIVAAWAEKEEASVQGESSLHTRWKFAFQYIEKDQGPPWWTQAPGTPFQAPEPPIATPESQATPQRAFGRQYLTIHANRNVRSKRLKSSEVDIDSFPSSANVQKCSRCDTFSAQVYQIEWMCLNADCNSFWTRQNGEPIPQDKLEFDPDFLHLRTLPEQLQTVPYSIVPEYPSWEGGTNGESIFNRQFWAGACCHRCGRVSCRQKWQHWECPSCKLRLEYSRPRLYPSTSLIDPMYLETYGNSNFNPGELATKERVVQFPNGEYRVVIHYELPGDAQIVHVLNNPAASQVPDQLLDQYQTDARETDMFHRHAIKTHGVKGELYAQHFSYNAGVPYKYIAEAISTPFDKCPQSVVGARDHIKYLCTSALGRDVDFNEVLSVAYAEGQEMNFHSDDEPGLGPVVAGLTLGSHAEMLFRYYVQCKKNLLYKNGPYKPSEVRTIDGQSERVLQVTLSHGDLLIMDGGNIQLQYEHAVFVRDNDFLRFAATARSIHAPPPMPTNSTGPRPEVAPQLHAPTPPEQIHYFNPSMEATHIMPPEHIRYMYSFASDI